METTEQLTRLIHDLNMLVERLLVFAVIVGIVGGALLVAVLLLHLKVGSLESKIDENTRKITKELGGKIDDIEIPQPRPSSPRSRRG